MILEAVDDDVFSQAYSTELEINLEPLSLHSGMISLSEIISSLIEANEETR